VLSLSVKNVPNKLARSLRDRAARNRRSLQGELLHILEEAVSERPETRPFDIDGLVRELRAIGLPPVPNESTGWIREDRDSR
jgi:plasmid stability protein